MPRAAIAVAPAEPGFRVTLPVPPGTNNLYATVAGRRVKTRQARDYAETAALLTIYALSQQGREALPVSTVGYAMTVDLWFPDRRRRDLDNIKILIDAVTEALGFDDSRLVRLVITKQVDASNPRADVLVQAA